MVVVPNGYRPALGPVIVTPSPVAVAAPGTTEAPPTWSASAVMGAGQVMDRGVAAEAVTIKEVPPACRPAASTAPTSTSATPSRTTQNRTRRATGIKSPSLTRESQCVPRANKLDRPIVGVKDM